MANKTAEGTAMVNKWQHHRASMRRLPYVNSKAVDTCFCEVLRAVLYGIGNCHLKSPPLQREDLFAVAVKAFQMDKRHAQNLLQQVSSQIPAQAMLVRVIGAENVTDHSAGADTYAKLYVADLQTLSKDGGEDTESTTVPTTSVRERQVHPTYDEQFMLDLNSTDGMGLLIEIWATAILDNSSTPPEEAGMLTRIFNRFSRASSAPEEEGVLASLLLPLHYIHPAGARKSYSMMSRSSLNTRCHLDISFIPDKSCEGDSEQQQTAAQVVDEFRGLARVFMEYQIETARETEKSQWFPSADSGWYKWSDEVDDIIARYAQQHYLTPVIQTALTIEAITKIHRSQPLPSKALAHFCQHLKDEVAQAETLKASETSLIQHTLDDVVNFTLGQLSVSPEVFPPTADHNLQELSDFVDILYGLQESDMWSAVLPDYTPSDLTEPANITLQVRVKAWYKTSVEFSMGFCKDLAGLCSLSQKMITVLTKFLAAFHSRDQSYHDLMARFDLDYDDVCLGQFHTLMLSDLDKFTRLARSTLDKELKASAVSQKNRQLLSTVCHLLQKLFSLTIQLETLLDGCGDEKPSKSLDSYGYYERLLPCWMKQLRLHSEDVTLTAIADEKLTIARSTSRVSSSSTGTLQSASTVITYLTELEKNWKTVCKWPDPVIAFLSSAQVLDVMADCARLYVQEMIALIPKWDLKKDSSRELLASKVCLMFKSINEFMEMCKSPPYWLEWPSTVETLREKQTGHQEDTDPHIATTGGHQGNQHPGDGQSPRQLAPSGLSATSTTDRIAAEMSSHGASSEPFAGPEVLATACDDLQRLARRVIQRVLTEIAARGHLSDLVQQVIYNASQQSAHAEEVLSPLIEWLKTTLAFFHNIDGVKDSIMTSVQYEMWNKVLSELLAVVTPGKGTRDTFCKLRDCISCSNGLLDTFVRLSDVGLSRQSLKTPAFQRLWHALLVLSCPPAHLTALHYNELLLNKIELGAGKHGQIQVSLRHTADDKLQLDVRNAKRLASIHGVCNSYVMVHFYPKVCFHVGSAPVRSCTVSKRNNPIYDFNIAVSMKDSSHQQAQLATPSRHQQQDLTDSREYCVAVVTVMHPSNQSSGQDTTDDEDVMLGQAIVPIFPRTRAQSSQGLSSSSSVTSLSLAASSHSSSSAVAASGRQTRYDLDLLLCPSDITRTHSSVMLRAISALQSTRGGNISAGEQAAILEKTLEMASASLAMQSQD